MGTIIVHRLNHIASVTRVSSGRSNHVDNQRHEKQLSKKKNEQKDTYVLIELVGAEVDNGLVVTAGVKHKDMATADVDEALGDARPDFGVLAEMLFDRLDRGLDVILKDGDRVRDSGLN